METLSNLGAWLSDNLFWVFVIAAGVISGGISYWLDSRKAKKAAAAATRKVAPRRPATKAPKPVPNGDLTTSPGPASDATEPPQDEARAEVEVDSNPDDEEIDKTPPRKIPADSWQDHWKALAVAWAVGGLIGTIAVVWYDHGVIESAKQGQAIAEYARDESVQSAAGCANERDELKLALDQANAAVTSGLDSLATATAVRDQAIVALAMATPLTDDAWALTTPDDPDLISGKCVGATFTWGDHVVNRTVKWDGQSLVLCPDTDSNDGDGNSSE